MAIKEVQTHVNGTSGMGMADLLIRIGTAQVSDEAKTRISAVLDTLVPLSAAEAFKLLSNANKAVKGTEKQGVVGVRASEAKQIIGAVKANLLNVADVAGKGWSNAVIEARKVLKEAGIRANGKPILSKEEQQQRREAVILAENIAGMTAEAKAETTLAEMASNAAETLMQSDAEKHAKRIFEAKGLTYVRFLLDYLLQYLPEEEAKSYTEEMAA